VHRLFRLIWGADFDPEIRPLLLVGFAETLAGSSIWSFVGIWAIKRLGASQSELSVTFLFGSIAAIAAGWAGGHLSDHIGRRPVMLGSAGAFALAPLGMLAAAHQVPAGLAVVAALGVFGASFNAASYALVADLLPPDRRDGGYAAVRVANNLGVCFGPVVGGALLTGGSWARLFVGAFALGVFSLVVAGRLLPQRGLYAPEQPPDRSSFRVVRRDHTFLVFVGAMVLASMTYLAYEQLLPISLTTAHGLAPSTWGFLAIINPVLVVLGQLRVTRLAARFSPSLRLAVAMPLMGAPFLVLRVADGTAVIAVIMVVFVVGEMLWVPTSQSVASSFAPPDLRGAYMGVYGSASQAAFALTPFAGLQIRAAFGDAAMWRAVAVVSVVAALAGAAVARERRVASVPA
jgi:predicted MFS family arabinose efflux permease